MLKTTAALAALLSTCTPSAPQPPAFPVCQDKVHLLEYRDALLRWTIDPSGMLIYRMDDPGPTQEHECRVEDFGMIFYDPQTMRTYCMTKEF